MKNWLPVTRIIHTEKMKKGISEEVMSLMKKKEKLSEYQRLTVLGYDKIYPSQKIDKNNRQEK